MWLTDVGRWQKDALIEAILTDMQSVRQKTAEAGHVQRQYAVMMDVLGQERVGYEKQLCDLEKEIADCKDETNKLRVGPHAHTLFLFKSIAFCH